MNEALVEQQVVPVAIESLSEGAETTAPSQAHASHSLIDFYEGRDSSGDGVPANLWSKILEARNGGEKPRELEAALRDRDLAKQADTMRGAIEDALAPTTTPNYFEDTVDPDTDPVEARARQIVADRDFAKVIEAHESRVEHAKSNHPDYEQVLVDYGHLPIHPAIQEAVIKLKHGPEVMYEAAKSGALGNLLTKMSPVEAVAELGRIGALIESGRTAVPVTTRAPKPPTPVRKPSASDDGELRDDLDPNEWKRRFLKKMEKR